MRALTINNFIEQLRESIGIPYLDVVCYQSHKQIYRYVSGKNATGKELLYMYSCGKPVTVVSALRLVEEGKLSLDDPIVKYFPDKLDKTPYAHLAAQTVRDMLSMRTAVRPPNWFTSADPDRTHEYLNEGRDIGPAGTVWAYDSAGSQVLASLVERLAGMSLLDYLNEKIFRHLDTFRTATVLKTPSGDSWGDSALICTSRDMASFARLLCKGGMHEGKRLIP